MTSRAFPCESQLPDPVSEGAAIGRSDRISAPVKHTVSQIRHDSIFHVVHFTIDQVSTRGVGMRRIAGVVTATFIAVLVLLGVAAPAQAWNWAPNFAAAWGTGEYVAEPGDTGPAPTELPDYYWTCQGTWADGVFTVNAGPGHRGGGSDTGEPYPINDPNDNSGNAIRDATPEENRMLCSWVYVSTVPSRAQECVAYSQFGGILGAGPIQGDTPTKCTDWDWRCVNLYGKDGYNPVTKQCYSNATPPVPVVTTPPITTPGSTPILNAPPRPPTSGTQSKPKQTCAVAAAKYRGVRATARACVVGKNRNAAATKAAQKKAHIAAKAKYLRAH